MKKLCSPLVNYSLIRYIYLLALAAEYELYIDEMDSVFNFLQGDLEQELYMGFKQASNGLRNYIHVKKTSV